GVQNAVFPAVVAGDDNRAAYGFIGTTTSGAGAFADDGSFQGVWHLYIAHTYDGGHTWILIDATPFDPVQKGQVCLKGTGCGAVRASGVVTVSWLEPDNGGSPITGYNVYRSMTSGTETLLATVPGNTTTKYIDSAAPSSSNWFYRVTAVNAVTEGPFCREVNVDGSAAAATACLAPYIKMGGPGIAGNISPDPSQGELTIESVNVGEPFT